MLIGNEMDFGSALYRRAGRIFKGSNASKAGKFSGISLTGKLANAFQEYIFRQLTNQQVRVDLVQKSTLIR